jgi:hypothetical protein
MSAATVRLRQRILDRSTILERAPEARKDLVTDAIGVDVRT